MTRPFASLIAFLVLCALAAPAPSLAETIGHVDTVFRAFSRDDDIIIEAFDDPDIDNVVCYLSRARRGGVKGMLGVAEDTSDASLHCLAVGPVALPDTVRSKKGDGGKVFKERTSLVFKSMQVVRFYDDKRGVLVYLIYSDKLVEGSPKNSISCVPVSVKQGRKGRIFVGGD